MNLERNLMVEVGGEKLSYDLLKSKTPYSPVSSTLSFAYLFGIKASTYEQG